MQRTLYSLFPGCLDVWKTMLPALLIVKLFLNQNASSAPSAADQKKQDRDSETTWKSPDDNQCWPRGRQKGYWGGQWRVDISHDKWWKSGDELIKASGNQALPSEEEAGGQVVDRAKHSRQKCNVWCRGISLQGRRRHSWSIAERGGQSVHLPAFYTLTYNKS